jgi:hypothetical protein
MEDYAVNPGMPAQVFPGKARIAVQIKKAAEAASPLAAVCRCTNPSVFQDN